MLNTKSILAVTQHHFRSGDFFDYRNKPYAVVRHEKGYLYFREPTLKDRARWFIRRIFGLRH